MSLLSVITRKRTTQDVFHGITKDGSAIVTSEIQSLLDDNAGKTIYLGATTDDLYVIDKVLIMPANTELVFNGRLFMTNGTTRALTADFLDGSDTISVDNSDGAYKVGQRVVFSDDQKPINGGGSYKTRKVGQTGVITSTTTTTITLDNAISNAFDGGYRTAQNAMVGHANSIFSIESADGITIRGSGVLDGNFENQYNIAGANYNRTLEDLRAAMGIAQFESDNITIDGLTIKDCVMHGIATNSDVTDNTNCTYQNLIFDANVDKAFAGLDLSNSLIDNCINRNGRDEGEIILYNGCDNVTISNITSSNNRRYGVAITGQNNSNLTLSNLNLSNNRVYDLYIQNQLVQSTITDVTCTGSTSQAACVVINSCQNVDITNLTISGKTASTTQLSILAGTSFASTTTNVNIDNLIMTNNNLSLAGRAISIEDTDGVDIDGITINGVGRVFRDGDNNANCNISNGTISNYTTLYELDNGNFNLTNVTT